MVPKLKLGKFTCKTLRNAFSRSANPHVLATHTRGTANRQLTRKANMEARASAASKRSPYAVLERNSLGSFGSTIPETNRVIPT